MSTSASEISKILSQIGSSDLTVSDRLLPLVYEELRQLAAARLAAEDGSQTFEPTDLVHEAYLRLVDPENPQHWNNCGHFFGAAAQAMRRILVDAARKKNSAKRGRHWKKVTLQGAEPQVAGSAEEMILLDETLTALSREDPLGARLVELRFFTGMTTEQAGEAIGVSAATAYRHWSFARAWLHSQLASMRET